MADGAPRARAWLAVATIALVSAACSVYGPELLQDAQPIPSDGGSIDAGLGDGAASASGQDAEVDTGLVDCAPEEKLCAGDCAKTSLPSVGCGGTTCLPCALPHVAEHGCEAEACTVVACAPGWADCNSDPVDGCETHLDSDADHCGSCGTACSTSDATQNWICQSGHCFVTACPPGLGDCDADPNNGCETSLDSHLEHCGACGFACDLPAASVTCALGACAVSSCDPGASDCDGIAANGCETPTAFDPANCGACGNVCVLPHAAESCAAGQCQVAACNSGWGDCDGVDANGCEVNLSTSAAHCGNCASACSSGYCLGGLCIHQRSP